MKTHTTENDNAVLAATQIAESNLSAEQVAEYLFNHPDYFAEHTDVLAKLVLPHPGAGTAVSLMERQAAVLRTKNQELEAKLLELVHIARDNERLSNQLHNLASELLATQSLSDVIAVVQDSLRDAFKTDFISLRLLPAVTDDTDLLLSAHAQSILFSEVLRSGKPICGRLNDAQINYLFSGHTDEVASAALVPLKAVTLLGVLVLASRDPQRFHPGMGHLFLSHLGDLISSAITTYQK
ncbi:MAG: DUF484 family protein [Gammaproteobacteria bacterium]|nr:DUF484 family protein [Gammaproteobacteria bacterium]